MTSKFDFIHQILTSGIKHVPKITIFSHNEDILIPDDVLGHTFDYHLPIDHMMISKGLPHRYDN